VVSSAPCLFIILYKHNNESCGHLYSLKPVLTSDVVWAQAINKRHAVLPLGTQGSTQLSPGTGTGKKCVHA
jgi:hypothetical protein